MQHARTRGRVVGGTRARQRRTRGPLLERATAPWRSPLHTGPAAAGRPGRAAVPLGRLGRGRGALVAGTVAVLGGAGVLLSRGAGPAPVPAPATAPGLALSAAQLAPWMPAPVPTTAATAQSAAPRAAATPAARSGVPRVVRRPHTPHDTAAALVRAHGWSDAQRQCLEALWQRESGWDPAAENPGSGAYGIPQALPATRMAEAGADWRDDPDTQVRWGVDYVAARYGTPCDADAHSRAWGWY